MNPATWHRHRFINAAQSMLLLAAMAGILGTLGWLIAGSVGVAWAVVAGALLVLLNPGISPRLVLRMYGAVPLGVHEAPGLHRLNRTLADRAGLAVAPALFYVPSAMLNAFTVGSREQAVVAVTDGLLRALAPRELAGVLAHEISHVRNDDMWVMGLADLFSRLTGFFAFAGQVLLLVNLPLLLFSDYQLSWTAIAILIVAPTASGLMQLALSRTREYDADLGAAALSSDPRGLASALGKMQRYEGGFAEQIFFPGRRLPDPSLLRTHPPLEERIRRLLELVDDPAVTGEPLHVQRLPQPRLSARVPAVERRPRWRANGLWY